MEKRPIVHQETMRPSLWMTGPMGNLIAICRPSLCQSPANHRDSDEITQELPNSSPCNNRTIPLEGMNNFNPIHCGPYQGQIEIAHSSTAIPENQTPIQSSPASPSPSKSPDCIPIKESEKNPTSPIMDQLNPETQPNGSTGSYSPYSPSTPINYDPPKDASVQAIPHMIECGVQTQTQPQSYLVSINLKS